LRSLVRSFSAHRISHRWCQPQSVVPSISESTITSCGSRVDSGSESRRGCTGDVIWQPAAAAAAAAVLASVSRTILPSVLRYRPPQRCSIAGYHLRLCGKLRLLTAVKYAPVSQHVICAFSTSRRTLSWCDRGSFGKDFVSERNMYVTSETFD